MNPVARVKTTNESNEPSPNALQAEVTIYCKTSAYSYATINHTTELVQTKSASRNIVALDSFRCQWIG